MLTAVYKSKKKADTYLFVEKREDFSRVPDALLATFVRCANFLILNLVQSEPF